MKKYFFCFITVLLLGYAAINAWAVNSSDPVGLLRSIADEMIANLKTNKATLKSNPRLVYSLAYKIIVPHADLSEMSRRVLPPSTWNSATPAQQAEFQKEFTTLLVRTYASALAEYKDQSIEFYPIRGGYQGKSEVKVDSRIFRTDGPSIEVNYRLVLKGQWKLFDMTIEGISMLGSFRSQFASQLAQGNIANLINTLHQHNSMNGG